LPNRQSIAADPVWPLITPAEILSMIRIMRMHCTFIIGFMDPLANVQNISKENLLCGSDGDESVLHHCTIFIASSHKMHADNVLHI
jgi:hypothetical protein